MRRIAVLTSGGDAPGMNAAIRAVVRMGVDKGWEMFGVRNGYAGLLDPQIEPLGARDVGGILQYGGTCLGSGRVPAFKNEEVRAVAMRNLGERKIDGLVVIGGNGSQAGALALSRMGLEVVGVASTIDNDLCGSEVTIGVDTALNIALEAIDRLRVTASSHKRAFLVEVMGRKCGYLALMAGIAGGADAVVLPEADIDPDALADGLHGAHARGKLHALVVVAEGARYNAQGLAAHFETNRERLGFDLRVTTLGHVQRGGEPSAFDRLLATRLAAGAIDHLARGSHGRLMGLVKGEIRSTPLEEVVGQPKVLDLSLLELQRALAKSAGPDRHKRTQRKRERNVNGNPSSNDPGSGFFDRFTERQMAIGVILFGLLLYLPFAGTYGLWDPWETHYSEVARQMTYRGDFISLWWPGSPRDLDVFWSKPVLSFWLMSIGMHIARIGLHGGDPGEMALSYRAEWAVRTPFVLTGVLGIYAIYLVTSRFVNRRAGVLAAVVVATAPMYSLVARQAMTDMAFVGPMSMALALGAMALFDDRDELLPRRGRGRFTWPHHGLFYGGLALFALTTIPQLAIDSYQLRVEIPWNGGALKMYGAVAMIPYFLGFVAFVVLAARTRYKAPLYLYIAAILCGLSVLAKGLAGLGLPLIVFIAYLAFTWNWRRLRRAQLLYGVVVSLLALIVVAAPWHHAMIIRHGMGFWNELFGDNHWRRMVLGRHGDRGTFEYFLRELGYAILPWVAVAPAALAWAVMRVGGGRNGKPIVATAPGADAPPIDAVAVDTAARAAAAADVRRQGIIWLGAIWFVSAYALVSLSMTKFHHYVLPAVPGLAIVIGCFLDDLVQRGATRRAAAVALVGVPLLFLVTVDLAESKSAAQRFLWLFSYDYVHNPHGRPWPESLDFTGAIIGFVVVFALATIGLTARRLRRASLVVLSVAAVLFTFYLLDVYMRAVAPFWSQKEPIATYYEKRRSPAERLIAYQMYWRGETFYTKNEIYEGPMEDRTVFDQDGADEKLKTWIEHHRGHRHFFLFERGQQAHLQSLLPPESRASFEVLDSRNNKFSLAKADL